MKTLLLISVSILTLVSCISRSPKANREEDRKHIDQQLGSELSLKQDRQALSDLRKEIPTETQKANDELALFLNLMGQGTESPQVVRDKFSSMVQKKRSAFHGKIRQLRDEYRKEESERRESFLDSQKSKRESFNRKKNDAKEHREFYSHQEKERATFSAEERSRRMNFEAELNAKSKDFDSYMREKQKEFDEQYRLYSKKFSEKPKDKKAATGDEFKRLDEAPATSLGTED